ncbi:glycoside hydrolase family 2 protein, partial [Arachidicoccus sp.]|uniref:glycoside hydrolase family 2 protein n=1 Tax=Arachidicoccus sp. TaxID=1872624 RepID=UPI003D1FC629
NNTLRKDVIPINDNLFPTYGGIYRPVDLIITNKLNITTTDYASSGIYIKQENVSVRSADIFVTEKIENTWHAPKNVIMQCAIYDNKGQLVKLQKQAIEVLSQGRQSFTQQITIDQPHLWWGRKDPYLYKVVTTILEREKVVDQVTQPLGIRSFKIVAEKGLFLNGESYKMYGVCRHQDWWSYGNALSYAQQDTDMALIKEIGATTIRFGHYQQSQHVYNDCDSIGFLVWTEIPFVNAVSGEEADNAKQQMTELIRQNYNHPSIYIWGTSNEVYCKTSDDYTARLIRTLNDLAKTEDPDRYTGSTNGFGNLDRPENFNTDVQGVNRYYGWYEGKTADLEKWVSGLEKNYPDAKVVLAEYGAGANVNQHTEEVPKSVNFSKQFFPEEYQTKVHETQWAIIKKNPYLVSSYIWNMFDFCVPGAKIGGVAARNMKGLITFDRKIKKDAFYWYKANWSREPVLYITDRRLTQRKNAVTNIEVYSNISAPILYVNGKEIKSFQTGATDVSYIFENVHLSKGINTIKVKAGKEGRAFEDMVNWTLL